MKNMQFILITIFSLLIGCSPDYGEEISHFPSKKNAIVVVAGGDVQFDLKIRRPRVITYHYPRSFSQKIWNKVFGFVPFPEYFLDIPKNSDKRTTTWYEAHSISYDLSFDNETELANYPFAKICSILRNADLAFVNLETPIADEGRCRVIGYFTSDSVFAHSLSNAGIDVVSIANNHAWDACEEGFLETIGNLEKEGIEYVGGGRNLKQARRPAIFNIHETRIAFLAYSQQFKYKFASVADNHHAGILPFSVRLVTQDIKNVKQKSDIVLVSLHWGIENSSKVHPKAIEMAHKIIDAGADAIIGHHSHVPKGIEVYNGRPIFYSLGNFIFGHNHKYWQDNFLAKILIKDDRIIGVEIMPISGKGSRLYQPELLTGDEAKRVLLDLKKLSSKLNTNILIGDNLGIISMPNPN